MRSYILGAVGTSMAGTLRRELRLAPEALPAEHAAAAFLRGQGGHPRGGHSDRAPRQLCRLIDRIASLGTPRIRGRLAIAGGPWPAGVFHSFSPWKTRWKPSGENRFAIR